MGDYDVKLLEELGVSPEEIPESFKCVVVGEADEEERAERVRVHSMALSALRGLCDCLADADPVFARRPLSDYQHWFEVFHKCPNTARCVTWIKYMVMYPIAKWLRQEDIPECPEDFRSALGGSKFPLPVSSTTRRHLKNLLLSSAKNRRAAVTFWAILQGVKRGCDAVPQEFIQEAMEKHRAALTKVLPELSEHWRELYRKKFRDLWHIPVRRGKWKAYLTRSEKRVGGNPNFHACVEKTRKKLGRAALAREFIRGEMEDQMDWATSGDMLIGMHEVRPGVVVESRGGTHLLPEVQPKWLTSRAAAKIRHKQYLTAKVAACLEPLKCRLITKGEGIPYWAAMPFQKMSWSWLAKRDQFALTREPLNSSHLEWILKREEDSGLKEMTHWVSGDYSAATDGLSQEINQLCLSEFLHSVRASSDEQLVCQKVLGNHKIGYPKLRGKDGESQVPGFTQQCGQLMGCPLSFPVLCAINLVAYWSALEEHTGLRFTVDQLPVLVNGDDILFRASPAFYEVWKEHVKRVGFTLSPGKNYIHETFLTANSAAYLHLKEGKDRVHRFQKVPYLNTGLLYTSRSERQARTIGVRNEILRMPFTQKANELTESCRDPVFAMKRFFRLYKAEIEAETHFGKTNLFAATELGGLGVHRPKGFETKYTHYQRQLAGYLYRQWQHIGRADAPASLKLLSDFNLLGEKVRTPQSLERVFETGDAVLVLRPKLEPLREDEARLPEVTGGLKNYQTLPDVDELDEEEGLMYVKTVPSEQEIRKRIRKPMLREFDKFVQLTADEPYVDRIGSKLHRIEEFPFEVRMKTDSWDAGLTPYVTAYKSQTGRETFLVPKVGFTL